MRGFIKPFLASFLGFTILFSGGLIAYNHFYGNQDSLSFEENEAKVAKAGKGIGEIVDSGKRVNILLLGADGGRSDTMMVLSVDAKAKSLKVLSIPRDTYYHVKGYDHMDQRKLNAVYGHGKDKGGVVAARDAIEDLTKLDIPYYVEVNYDAVKAIVDILGGVDFEVPFDMNYDDAYAKPELHIHLKQGMQTLDGEKAMQFLRWRKNNGSEGTGDIDRIKRQQAFITSAAKKAFGLKLPMVIKSAFEHINTNMNTGDMVYLGTQLMGTDLQQAQKETLPGEVGSKQGYSFLIPDEAGIAALHDGYTNAAPEKK